MKLNPLLDISEAETVDEVDDVMDGIAVKVGIGGDGDSRAETAKVDDKCELNNVTTGIESE